MKYSGFYYALFRGTMKKTLAERFGAEFAKRTMAASDPLYRRLVEGMDDLGDGNPMAYNALFALAFVSPYLASGKQISPEIVQEMMRRSLYRVRFYFTAVNLNTPRGKKAHRSSVTAYQRWYTPERQRRYPTSFLVDEVGKPYPDACYYRITRCPICAYCEKLGVSELMPLLCDLDNVMIGFQHGRLHREHTIAGGGPYCDYYVTGDREAEAASEGTAKE